LILDKLANCAHDLPTYLGGEKRPWAPLLL
jgi:hypothetical protein